MTDATTSNKSTRSYYVLRYTLYDFIVCESVKICYSAPYVSPKNDD